MLTDDEMKLRNSSDVAGMMARSTKLRKFKKTNAGYMIIGLATNGIEVIVYYFVFSLAISNPRVRSTLDTSTNY